jgi:glycosyltransferase involved in cell wall biosynthesis
MKLLFITQKIDQHDDLLGVYHEWVLRLAPQFEKIHTIALMVGAHNLPQNIVIHSLGKETKRSRIRYIARFFKYIWQFRNEYDVVFVHMNTEYVLLGWWLWKLLGKRMVLWFAHYRPDWKLRFAEKVVERIVTSAPEACAIRSKKVVAIGQAIDTEKFYNTKKARTPRSILFVGRIAPVKKIEFLIDAFAEIKKSFSDAALHIIGEPGEKDRQYAESIQKRIAGKNCADDIVFRGKVANTETPAIYNQYEIFVNLTPTGSFDKTILEAMACETLIVVSNRAYLHILPKDLQTILLFRENNAADLAQKLENILRMSAEEKKAIGKRLRQCVAAGHSMEHLIAKLSEVLKSKLQNPNTK